jgi:hypothetical protein
MREENKKVKKKIKIMKKKEIGKKKAENGGIH